MPRLLLLYNADSGRRAAWIDSLFKAVGKPRCSLCALTHGLFRERSAWRRFRDDQERRGLSFVGIHRDESTQELREATDGRLPAIVLRCSGQDRVLLDASRIDACADVEDLVQRTAESLGSVFDD